MQIALAILQCELLRQTETMCPIVPTVLKNAFASDLTAISLCAKSTGNQSLRLHQ